jgi:uncharacterized protein (TIGR02594 family)
VHAFFPAALGQSHAKLLRISAVRAVIYALMLAAASPTPVEAASLLNAAKAYIGLDERANTATLSRVLGVNPRRVPWCGFFVAALVKRFGGKLPEGHGQAMAWKNAGQPVTLMSARPGDIVVMGRHVMIYSKREGKRVCGVGGNQSNKVRETCYSARGVVAVRRVAR